MMKVRFGEFELDREGGILLRGGTELRIQEQPLQILLALVETPGAIVSREQLRERLWPDGTFVDFDQSLHTAVRKLRQSLDDSAEAPRYVETIARKGYRFIGTIDSSRKKRLWPWLAVAIVPIAIGAWMIARAPRREIRSVAVLPFVNLTGKADQQAVADALTDSLISDLAAAPALRVISHTTAAHYAGTKQPLPEITKALRVEAIVEGSVAMDGDRLRVTTRLVDAATDAPRWTRDYERRVADLAGLQNELAEAIAAQTWAKLVAPVRGRGCSAEAYLLCQNGRQTLNRGRFVLIPQAVAYFRAALAKSPDCALAYSGLAEAALFSAQKRLPTESMAEAKQHAETALRLDPTSADAHASLGMVRMFLDHDWEGAENDFRAALAIEPGSAPAHERYAMLLAACKRFDAAIREARRAADLDPLAPVMWIDLGRIEYFARRYDDARRDFDRALRLDPDSWLARSFYASTYLVQGRFDDSFSYVRNWMVSSHAPPSAIDAFDASYRNGGVRAAMPVVLSTEITNAKRNGYVQSSSLAILFSGAGLKNESLDWLETAYRSHTRDMVYVAVEPAFDSIRGTDRYRAVVRAVGLN